MHVYGRKGDQIVAINSDGSGHDGSSGKPVPSKVADLARALGFQVPSSNLLESMGIGDNLGELDELIVIIEHGGGEARA